MEDSDPSVEESTPPGAASPTQEEMLPGIYMTPILKMALQRLLANCFLLLLFLLSVSVREI